MKTYFDENKPREDFGRRSLRGGIVSIGARGINALVQVGSVVVLARLLTPVDYGLVGMVSAIVGIAPLLIDLGTRDAVIQQRHITPQEISALFWITVFLGCVFAVLTAVSGPLIAHFYREPRLTMVAVVSSFSIVLLSMSYQHQALLRRSMKYHDLAMIDIIASVVSTVIAIVMALKGFAYWALALRPVTVGLMTAIGVFWRCRWLPGKPAFTGGVKEMIQFGLHWVGFSGFDFIGKFGDRVAIGYAAGASGLGFYQKACLVYDNSLDLMTTPLQSVALVGLSKLRNMPEQLWESWSKAISTMAFFAMPAFGILAVISRDIIVLALGEKWVGASVLLSVLALRGIPHVVLRTCGWLHMAAGRADRFMRWGVISSAAQLVALFAGLPFGTLGIVWSYVLCTYVLFLPAITYSGRPLGIGIGKVIRVVGPQTIGSLTAVAICFALRETEFAQTQMVLRMALLVTCFTAIYTAIVVGLFRVRTPLYVSRSVLRACVA